MNADTVAEYECLSCGYRDRTESHTETCPRCGSQMWNLSLSHE